MVGASRMRDLGDRKHGLESVQRVRGVLLLVLHMRPGGENEDW